MENPATWGDLHHEINVPLFGGTLTDKERAEGVVSVLNKNSITSLGVEKILELIVRHRELMETGFCGLSLTAQIVNAT